MLSTLKEELPHMGNLLRDVYDLCILRLSFRNHNEITTDNYNYGAWIWEKYHPQFYRAAPMNYTSFILSPIFKLIQCINFRWKNTKEFEEGLTKVLNLDMNSLQLEYIVIQKIPKGSGIDPHNDEWQGRRIAWIYYLTEDNLTLEDGGNFCVISDNDPDKYDCFIPEFNSMIMMTMSENKSPLHKVDTVNSDKNRYALVGFLCDKVD